MEIAASPDTPSRKASILEKIFFVHPENTIGRTTYTLRIIALWIVNGILSLNMQTIFIYLLLLTSSVGVTYFFMMLFIGILIYISFIQIYKRISDYDGSKKVFWIMALLAIIAFIAVLFNKDLKSLSGVIASYTIIVSVFRSSKEKMILKTIEDKRYILSEVDGDYLISKNGDSSNKVIKKNPSALAYIIKRIFRDIGVFIVVGVGTNWLFEKCFDIKPSFATLFIYGMIGVIFLHWIIKIKSNKNEVSENIVLGNHGGLIMSGIIIIILFILFLLLLVAMGA